MKTDLVIVTYNSVSYIQRCLEAIRTYTPPGYTIIVVDNGSTDGTLEYLQSFGNIELIENGQNKGYASAVNLGIKNGTSETIVIMNPDVFVTENWLPPLMDTLWKEEQTAIVAPKLINSSNQLVGVGTNWDWTSPYFLCPNEPGILEETRACLAINGACFLLKRHLLDKLGLLDEHYFHYFEETDYCFNAIHCGYNILFCPDSTIYHEYYPNPARDEAIKQYWVQSETHFNRKWSYQGNGIVAKNVQKEGG
ncbi:glycosyltransferase family 2 protein [Paenibacillus lentus]|uniref:glycosyltransferase family 2 protein n=1 Tax=Paenibacillus lentus TaxID=1338368 RepID=UPI0013DD893B|nr:glycosyltransferase family 2 protein [Paenibacillus lentus]